MDIGTVWDVLKIKITESIMVSFSTTDLLVFNLSIINLNEAYIFIFIIYFFLIYYLDIKLSLLFL